MKVLFGEAVTGNPIWGLRGNRPCSRPGLPLGTFIGYDSSICPYFHRTVSSTSPLQWRLCSVDITSENQAT